MLQKCRYCGYDRFTAVSFGGLIKCICKDCHNKKFLYKSNVPNWNEKFDGDDMEINEDGTVKFYSF